MIRMKAMNSAVLISAFTLVNSGILMVPSKVLAWGTAGHRTVSEIAQDLLLPETEKRITEVLQGQKMSEVSIWADSVRKQSEWSFTAWYHFEKIFDGKDFLKNIQQLPQTDRELGGVVTAILQAEKVFTNPRSTTADKESALKFIIHFVGDLHQPLHTGRPEDKGGNSIPRTWEGFKTNLHAIWDFYIIETGHAELFQTADSSTPEVVYAPYLKTKFKNLRLSSRQVQDINMWVNESLAMRPAAYEFMDEDPEEYTERFLSAVDQRVYVAGVRLAAMLNEMVMKEQPPTVRVQFLAAIEKVTGSISKFISIRPKAPREDIEEPGKGNSRRRQLL